MIKMDLVSDVHHMYLVNITAIYNAKNATTGGDVNVQRSVRDITGDIIIQVIITIGIRIIDIYQSTNTLLMLNDIGLFLNISAINLL